MEINNFHIVLFIFYSHFGSLLPRVPIILEVTVILDPISLGTLILLLLSFMMKGIYSSSVGNTNGFHLLCAVFPGPMTCLSFHDLSIFYFSGAIVTISITTHWVLQTLERSWKISSRVWRHVDLAWGANQNILYWDSWNNMAAPDPVMEHLLLQFIVSLNIDLKLN